MGEPWMKDDEYYDRCTPCLQGAHRKHQPLFETIDRDDERRRREEDNTIYGPFSCDCACAEENRKFAVEQLLQEAFNQRGE